MAAQSETGAMNTQAGTPRKTRKNRSNGIGNEGWMEGGRDIDEGKKRINEHAERNSTLTKEQK